MLPARVPGYQPRLLDELGAMGEVGWVGRGSLGRDDGRIALFRPGRDALRPVDAAGRRGAARRASATTGIREHLDRRGASFYREIHAAAGGGSDRDDARRAVGPGLGRRGHQRHVRAAARAALEAPDRRQRARGPGRAA